MLNQGKRFVAVMALDTGDDRLRIVRAVSVPKPRYMLVSPRANAVERIFKELPCKMCKR